MSDYISRDEIFSVWRSMPKPASISSLTDAINRTPAADVEPVRHGRWVYKPSTTTTLSTTNCSVCGWWTQDFAVVGTYCFCPSCGAKMCLEEDTYEM